MFEQLINSVHLSNLRMNPKRFTKNLFLLFFLFFFFFFSFSFWAMVAVWAWEKVAKRSACRAGRGSCLLGRLSVSDGRDSTATCIQTLSVGDCGQPQTSSGVRTPTMLLLPRDGLGLVARASVRGRITSYKLMRWTMADRADLARISIDLASPIIRLRN